MSRSIEITVYGEPAPQGSKRFVGIKGGRGMMIESSKKVKPWREAVKYAAIEAIEKTGLPCLLGAINLRVTFTMPKPKSAPKRRRSWPSTKPDLSKLVRSTEDALSDAGVWEDDARVICCTALKVFPGEHHDALHTPGAIILITSVEEAYLEANPSLRPRPAAPLQAHPEMPAPAGS